MSGFMVNERRGQLAGLARFRRAKEKRQPNDCLVCGPSWDRTSDPLIMSQVLLTI